MGLSDKIIKKLNEPLDASRVKTRPGPGGKKLSYLEGHDCISTANVIFGVGNWGYAVQQIECVGHGKIMVKDPEDPEMLLEEHRMMYYAVVELRVLDCAPITEAGFGTTRGDRPEHHEMAVKGAVTDGLKRCLKNYGVQFGLGLYAGDVPPAIPADLGSMVLAGKKHEGKTLAEVYKEDPDYLGWLSTNWRDQDVREAVKRYIQEQEAAPPEGEMITLPSGNVVPANKRVTAGWAKSLVDLSVEAGWDEPGVHLKNHLKKHYGVASTSVLTFKQALAFREHLAGLIEEQPGKEEEVSEQAEEEPGEEEEKPEQAGVVLDEAILDIAAKAGFDQGEASNFVNEKMGDAELTPVCYQAFMAYFNALASGTDQKVVDMVLDASLERLKEVQAEE